MPKPRLDDTQLRAILDAVAQVVAARTASRAPLAEMARAAGVSIGTLQHYFGSRDELIAAAFRHVNGTEAERARELVERRGDPRDQLAAVLDGMLGENTSDWLLWSEFWSSNARASSTHDQTVAIYGAWEELVDAVLATGVANGVFRPARPVTEIRERLITFSDGLSVQLLVGRLEHGQARALLDQLAAEQLGFDSGEPAAPATGEDDR